MKLHLIHPSGNRIITGYGHGWVEINDVRYRENLIVLPAQLVTGWSATGFDQLTEAHLQQISALEPEVVLLGAGPRHRLVAPRLSRCLTDAGIGLECMDTAAACRTYNILMTEGRKVAAALLL